MCIPPSTPSKLRSAFKLLNFFFFNARLGKLDHNLDSYYTLLFPTLQLCSSREGREEWKPQPLQAERTMCWWERKNNFPSTLLGSWPRPPCNKSQINRRNTNRNLITYILPVYMGEIQEN